jgi:hypothetical protein
MIKKIIISGLIAISFVACGDDGGNSLGGGVKSGTFSDSVVEGLAYSTSSQNGVTDAKGTFKYKDGETVEFKIGGIELGFAKAQTYMTPVTLISYRGDTNYNNSYVVYMLQFLQSIDSDHNASNGIKISDELRAGAEAETISFGADVDLNELYERLSVKKEHQVTKDAAVAHFKKTLDEIHKPANPKEFSIIKGVYQDGTTILDITSSGVINSYQYNKIDNCIRTISGQDYKYRGGYAMNGKVLTHDANKKEFTLLIGEEKSGWKYENKKITKVFSEGMSTGGTINIDINGTHRFLTTTKSTKYHTSADITNNMCYVIGETKKYENIKGVYQYEAFENATTQAAVRAVVTHINKDGKIASYKEDGDCLNVAVSGDYNFNLNDKTLSKGVYADNNNFLEYFYSNSNGDDKFSWIENPKAEISHIAFHRSGEVNASVSTTIINIGTGHSLTKFKSTKYTEANIASKMCN